MVRTQTKKQGILLTIIAINSGQVCRGLIDDSRRRQTKAQSGFQ